MKRKVIQKLAALVSAGTMTAALLAGCGSTGGAAESAGSSDTAADGDSIPVGVISPNTGNLATYGESVLNGIPLYPMMIRQIPQRVQMPLTDW